MTKLLKVKFDGFCRRAQRPPHSNFLLLKTLIAVREKRGIPNVEWTIDGPVHEHSHSHNASLPDE